MNRSGSPYSFVTTIDLVSILSRGAAPFGVRGLMNETCGQTNGVGISASAIFIRPKGHLLGKGDA